jgi:hypothetical protein
MRIGTWNLAGRWSDRHLELLVAAKCDVWLLTEVSDRLDLPQFVGHVTDAAMRSKVRWAGVFSRSPLEPLADPHPASAMARVDGTTYVSSILPWRGTGDVEPWIGENHGARTRHALKVLDVAMPQSDLVWGGDWNHALSGKEYAGSLAGRDAIRGLLQRRDLSGATAGLPHALDGLLSIDHIAVPSTWQVLTAQRISAADIGTRLSDHDQYLVDAHPS